MDNPIKLFKTSKGQAQYFATYDAALGLWPILYESRFVTTPYGRTHVISCGPDDGFPLLLLHAGQASSTMWFPNIADLSGKFLCWPWTPPENPARAFHRGVMIQDAIVQPGLRAFWMNWEFPGHT
jgi:hypothetical protein